MKLQLFNINTYTEDLPEIVNPKHFESGKFSRSGLFSQQIFGPVKSYLCGCNRAVYRGRSSTEKNCPHCSVEIVSSEERRKRYGKVKLPFEIVNPIFLKLLGMIKPNMKRAVLDMLTYGNYYNILENGNLEKISIIEEDTDRENLIIGIAGIKKYIEFLIEKESHRSEVQFLRDNLDKLTIDSIVVIPPDFRPTSSAKNSARIYDEINAFYSNLIVKSITIQNLPFTITETDDIYQTTFKHIQLTTINLFDFVLSKMSKKEGLIRSNILGKRVDFSGRAVISPDPTLKLDECRVPYFMLLEILKPQLTSHLVNRSVTKRYNSAVKLIEDCIVNRDYSLFDLVNEFCESKNKLCILNRQPTLHRLGVLGFKVRPDRRGKTIKIPPLACTPYNADFDGDAMAIYFCTSERSEKDIIEKVGIWNNLISQTDMQIVPRPNQDIILGLYLLTSEGQKEEDENKEPPNYREIKGQKVTYHRFLFNSCLPDDYPVVDIEMNKRRIMNLLNDIAIKYPPNIVIEVLDKLKNLGFLMSTLQGYTLSLEELYDDRLYNISQELTGDMREDFRKFISDDVMEILKEKPYADYIESGARGSWGQIKQLVLSRGYVSDAKGRIRPNLIRNSLLQGYTQREFFDSAWGSRKGLLDTALSTGDSGYLTRQLIYSTVFIKLDKNLEDCGTTDYREVYVKDSKMSKSLLWRYVLVDGNLKRITKSKPTSETCVNYKDIVEKKIKLRSPIYCKSKKICQKCYGELFRILHSQEIGVIATQSIGERTTQLVLQTFHTGGVANQTSRTEGEQDDIISGIHIANKLFHKPTELKKLDGSGENVASVEDLLDTIYTIFSEYGNIHSVHYEIVVSVMMWSGNSLWRLLENRDTETFEWTSILQVPSKASWLLGCAFSNLKTKILEGLIRQREDESSSLSNLFKYK